MPLRPAVQATSSSVGWRETRWRLRGLWGSTVERRREGLTLGSVGPKLPTLPSTPAPTLGPDPIPSDTQLPSSLSCHL